MTAVNGHTLFFQPKRLVRATLNVAMLTQTIIVPREDGEKLTRDHVTCKITYSANGECHELQYEETF